MTFGGDGNGRAGLGFGYAIDADEAAQDRVARAGASGDMTVVDEEFIEALFPGHRFTRSRPRHKWRGGFAVTCR